MPSQTQLVPEYEQPYSFTHINDNTTFVEDIPRVEEFTGTTTAFVTTADKGPSNTWVDVRSQEELDEMFGIANMKKHGQPLYNAQAFFTNDDTRAMIFRALPEDATYANSVVVAKVKATPAVGADPGPAAPGSFSVKLDTFQITDLGSLDDVRAEMQALTTETADSEGYIQIPLFAFAAHGAGQYGNDIRIRIVKDFLTDIDNLFVNYRMDICEIEGSLLVKRALSGSLFEGAVEDDQTIYFEDAVNDDESPLQKIKMFVNEEGFENLYDLYIDTVQPETIVPFAQFDFIYGLQRLTKEPIPGYTLEPAALDDFSLDSTEGVALTGGSDGIFDADVLAAYNKEHVGAEKTFEAERDKLFIAAFKGETDPVIKSRRRVPLNYLTDANYTAEVKTAIVDLFDHRRDFQLYLDGGIMETVEQAMLWLADVEKAAHHYSIVHEFNHYKVRDGNTGRKVPVTTMFYLHQELPAIFNDSLSKVLAGATNATITNMVKNSMLPVIDEDDLALKEKFYKKNVVYYTCYGENLYMRSVQQTSQNAISDLSEENNVRVLLDIKRNVENFANNRSYSFTTAADREALNRDAQDYVKTYYPEHVQEFSIIFRANEWERKRKINHGYISVAFKELGKRSIIEIDVNPPSAAAASADE